MRLIWLMIGIAAFCLISWGLFGGSLEAVWNLKTLVGDFSQTKSWAWLLN